MSTLTKSDTKITSFTSHSQQLFKQVLFLGWSNLSLLPGLPGLVEAVLRAGRRWVRDDQPARLPTGKMGQNNLKISVKTFLFMNWSSGLWFGLQALALFSQDP